MYKPRSGRGPVVTSKPLAIIKGVLSGYVLTLLMILLLTYLLFKFDISESQIYIGVVITYIFATLLTGLITGKSIRQNAWIWGTLSGFVYFLILTIVSVIINGELTTIKEMVTTFALCLGGGTLGGMFS